LVRRIPLEPTAGRRQVQRIEEFVNAEPRCQQSISEKEAFCILGWLGELTQPAKGEMRGGDGVLALAPSVRRPS
jgi:hypothetical protein